VTTDRRRLLQQLVFSESRHFSWDMFPAKTMANDRQGETRWGCTAQNSGDLKTSQRVFLMFKRCLKSEIRFHRGRVQQSSDGFADFALTAMALRGGEKKKSVRRDFGSAV
jgi:hypothetical protein